MVHRQSSLFDEYESSREEAIGVLDDLLARTNGYRSSRAFAKILQFIGRLPQYAPFNAALLYAQNPQLRYVASAKRWREDFRRHLKSGARAYVVLVPFGPVQLVYDITDTVAMDAAVDVVPEELHDPFQTTGTFAANVWHRTASRCPLESISLVEDRSLGDRLAGNIRPLRPQRESDSPRYLLRVNGRHDLATRYATLTHELAHLFCGHIGTDEGAWWDSRPGLDTRRAELEAEGVAYLVCERIGLNIHSERYLSGYVGAEDFELPDLSLDTVLAATSYIEAMRKPRFKTKRKNKRRP